MIQDIHPDLQLLLLYYSLLVPKEERGQVYSNSLLYIKGSKRAVFSAPKPWDITIQPSFPAMASLSFLATTNSSPLRHPPKPPSTTVPRRRFYTSCNSRKGNNKNTANTANATDNKSRREKSESGSVLRLDRRNVLLGLGGLYGASTLTGRGKMAVGAPIDPPDLSKCHLADGGDGVGDVQCCPPYDSSTPIIDYEFPSSSLPMRVRRPAHLLGDEDIAKYKEAITKLRELYVSDPDDPRGWMQQANVHCQFCNGAFDQLGFDDVLLQVHYSWLFLPWHRW